MNAMPIETSPEGACRIVFALAFVGAELASARFASISAFAGMV